MARRIMASALLLFTFALVGCDQATKVVARHVLEARGPIGIVPGALELRYAENRDTAFSLLHGTHLPEKTALITLLALGALVVIGALWWRRRDAPRLEQAAYGLIVAGALGNIIDRARTGFVVDFI